MSAEDRAAADRAAAGAHAVRVFALWAFVIAMPLNLLAMTAAIGLAAAATLVLFVTRRGELSRTPLDLPIGLLLLAVGLSLALGRSDAVVFDSAMSWWPCLVFFVAFFGTREEGRRLERFFDVLLAVAAVLAVYSIVQHFTGIDWFNTLLGGEPRVHRHVLAGEAQRWVAVGRYDRHSNHAFAVLFFLSLALAQALGRTGSGASWRELALRWGLVALFGVELVVTYVRAAWLGAAIGVLVLGAIRGRRTLLALMLAGAVVFGAAGAASPSIRAKLLTVFDPQYEANQHRIFLWERSLEMAADHPLFGIGWGNYQAVCPEYIDRVDPEFPYKFRAHSLYLNLVAETGLCGALAFVFLWIVVFRELIRRLRARPPGEFEHRLLTAVIVGLTAFLVGSITTDAMYNGDVSFVLWFLLGAALGRAGPAQQREATS